MIELNKKIDIDNISVDDVRDFRDGRVFPPMPDWVIFYRFAGETRWVFSNESHTKDTFLKWAKSLLKRKLKRRMHD